MRWFLYSNSKTNIFNTSEPHNAPSVRQGTRRQFSHCRLLDTGVFFSHLATIFTLAPVLLGRSGIPRPVWVCESKFRGVRKGQGWHTFSCSKDILILSSPKQDVINCYGYRTGRYGTGTDSLRARELPNQSMYSVHFGYKLFTLIPTKCTVFYCDFKT